MGNCCEAIDFKLNEFVEANDVNNTGKGNYIYSHEPSDSTSELLSNNTISEEISKKFLKFRNQRHKLKTIIEDNHEDNISSPFLLKRKQYH